MLDGLVHEDSPPVSGHACTVGNFCLRRAAGERRDVAVISVSVRKPTVVVPVLADRAGQWYEGFALDTFLLTCKTNVNGDTDGIPVVLMAAMSPGVPVVSACSSGIPKLVRHRETNLLVQPNDAAPVVQKITTLIGIPTLRTTLATMHSHIEPKSSAKQ